MANPSPWAAPVTRARFPSISPMAVSFRLSRAAAEPGQHCPARPSSATEAWPEKGRLLWRPRQPPGRAGAGPAGEPVPLHRPPHLEGRDRPLQAGPGQLLEPAEAVPDRVLVHVEGLGRGLDVEAVLDEGGHGLGHAGGPGARAAPAVGGSARPAARRARPRPPRPPAARGPRAGRPRAGRTVGRPRGPGWRWRRTARWRPDRQRGRPPPSRGSPPSPAASAPPRRRRPPARRRSRGDPRPAGRR